MRKTMLERLGEVSLFVKLQYLKSEYVDLSFLVAVKKTSFTR